MTDDTDPRTGHNESGFVTVASGDGTTPQTAFDIPSDALFKLEKVKLQYADAATVNCEVAIHDDEDGTTAGNLADKRDEVLDLAPGDTVTVDADYRIFEEGVLAATQGSQDGDLNVTVYGKVLTDLRDVT